MPARTIALLAALTVAALVATGQAQASWTATDLDPSVIASDFNHRDFTVVLDGVGDGYAGQAFVGGDQNRLWLTRLAYQGARRGQGQSVWILLHEIAHTIGIGDEHAASVWGYQHLVGVLRHYYGQSAQQARGGYREAVVMTLGMAPEYRP